MRRDPGSLLEKPFGAAAVLAAAVAAFVGGPAAADTILLKDGRFYTVPKITAKDEVLEVHYRNGVVPVRREIVKEYFLDDPGDDLSGLSAEDQDKVAKGLVPFEGRWVPKATRDREVAKRVEAKRAEFEEFKKHQNWRDRYLEETKHFAFEYTVPKDLAAEYMDMFEVYYEVFAKEWRISQPRGKKLKICFYNNIDDFQRIGGVGPGVLGYYRFVEPLELNFFLERRDERLTLDVLFHEMNHYLFDLLAENNWQFAPWLNEGMAEYYGASSWDPSTRKMTLGNLQEGRLVNLKSELDGGTVQDLRALMSESDINALQYAWSWTLCHMIMEDKKLKPAFLKYVNRIAKDGKLDREPNPRNMNFQWVKVDAAIELFQSMLGIKDLDAFEQRWYDYIKSLDVQSARGFHRAAMDCVRWDRPLRAEMYFKQAIDRYSSNPETYEEYGDLLIEQDKAAEAVPVLEKARELDPLNPHVHKRLGEAYRRLDGEDNKEKGKSLQLLAVEMDPYDAGLLFGLDSDVLAAIPEASN